MVKWLITVTFWVWLAAPLAFADDGSTGIIDSEISAALRVSGIMPAPRAADQELARRLYLDLLGRIPTAAEMRAFLEDSKTDKSEKLIEQLLAHEEMPVYWASVIDHWLCGSATEREFGRDAFLAYLEEAIRANRPWNQTGRELLAADFTDERQRGAAYFLAVRLRSGDNEEKLDNMTGAVASGLFGIQLQCAKCHDHPFVDDLKQDHYYGLAAFLGRTQEARIKDLLLVREKADGEVKFVTTKKEEKTAKLLFLDGKTFDEPQRPADQKDWYTKSQGELPDVPYFSRRHTLAEYALTGDNAYFKRAIVNRVWKQLLGRGLVEPVDQMHTANPASHPALLERLADDFDLSGFDLRRLLSSIVHSDAYQRSSRWPGSGDRPADKDFAVAILRPLSPTQFTLSIAHATGAYSQFQAKLERDASKEKADAISPIFVRRRHARERDVQEFASRFYSQSDAFDANAGQALFLAYNQSFLKQLQPGNGNLVERLTKRSDESAAIEEAYLQILSRAPTSEEQERLKEVFAQPGARADTCREMVWALICSAEFRFNY